MGNKSISGMGIDGRTMVTKDVIRYRHTLENLGTAQAEYKPLL